MAKKYSKYDDMIDDMIKKDENDDDNEMFNDMFNDDDNDMFKEDDNEDYEENGVYKGFTPERFFVDDYKINEEGLLNKVMKAADAEADDVEADKLSMPAQLNNIFNFPVDTEEQTLESYEKRAIIHMKNKEKKRASGGQLLHHIIKVLEEEQGDQSKRKRRRTSAEVITHCKAQSQFIDHERSPTSWLKASQFE